MGKFGNQRKNQDTGNSRTMEKAKVYHRKKKGIRDTGNKMMQKETGKQKGKQGMGMQRKTNVNF